MTWRREDYGYAAATVAAVVFLAYLIAGNFGIVPSPLGAARSDGLPQPDVAILAAGRDLGPAVPQAPIAPAPPTPAPTQAPKPKPHVYALPAVAISTTSGTKVTLADPGLVTGTAKAEAKVLQVIVNFTPQGGAPASVTATLHCDAPVQNCSWSAQVPSVAGAYDVTATVTDGLARTATSKPISITVLNPGSVVGGVTKTVGGVVQQAPQTLDAVAGAINNLVGLLHL